MRGFAVLAAAILKNLFSEADIDWSDPSLAIRTALQRALPTGFDLDVFLTQVQLLPVEIPNHLKAFDIRIASIEARVCKLQTMLQFLVEEEMKRNGESGVTGDIGSSRQLTNGSDRSGDRTSGD